MGRKSVIYEHKFDDMEEPVQWRGQVQFKCNATGKMKRWWAPTLIKRIIKHHNNRLSDFERDYKSKEAAEDVVEQPQEVAIIVPEEEMTPELSLMTNYKAAKLNKDRKQQLDIQKRFKKEFGKDIKTELELLESQSVI